MESSPIYLSIPYLLFLSTRNSQPRKRQQKYINIPEDKLDNQSYTFHIDIKITDSLRIHISSLFNDRLDHRHFTPWNASINSINGRARTQRGNRDKRVKTDDEKRKKRYEDGKEKEWVEDQRDIFTVVACEGGRKGRNVLWFRATEGKNRGKTWHECASTVAPLPSHGYSRETKQP